MWSVKVSTWPADYLFARADGYDTRFGVTYVDLATQRRTTKSSYDFLKKVRLPSRVAFYSSRAVAHDIHALVVCRSHFHMIYRFGNGVGTLEVHCSIIVL